MSTESPRGIPYSLSEAEAVAANGFMDPYYLGLLSRLIAEVRRLTAEVASLRANADFEKGLK